MNGYELAKELRSLREYRTVPVIGIPGFAEFDDLHTAIWAGFENTSHKPVEPAKLLEMIKSCAKTINCQRPSYHSWPKAFSSALANRP